MTRFDASSGECRILVAEADGTLRLALREALDLMGYEAELARDAIHAGSLLSTGDHGFDAVVVDFATAVAGGLLRRLQEEELPIPAVVLLPQGESYRSYEARTAGATTVLSKPVRMPALKRALMRALARIGGDPARDGR